MMGMKVSGQAELIELLRNLSAAGVESISARRLEDGSYEVKWEVKDE